MIRSATCRAKPHFMRHDQHGDAVAGEFHHRVEHLLDHLGIERGGGFVEQHDVRAHAQCARDGDALLLAAGEPGWVFLRLVRYPHAPQETHGKLFGVFLRHMADPDRRQSAVFQHREMREQVELLKHHADVAAYREDLLGIVGQLLAVDDDTAALPVFEAVDAAKHRRFAAAGWTADDDALAPRDRQIDVAQHVEIAVPLVQGADLNGPSCLFAAGPV